jgi:hypothetical protein
MKKFLITILTAFCFCGAAFAQSTVPVEGIPYFLPKTAVRLSVWVEKTTYTPGEFAKYAEKYMKLMNVDMEPKTTYRIVKTAFSAYGVPDSSKHYMALMDRRHNITDVRRNDNGVLLAINATPKKVTLPTVFVPARKAQPLNPRDYMSEDVLSAGSSAKMAELIAKDIYDIRDSRNLLSRGQAEFMPKDGEQLKLMLKNLDTQEKALMQVFEGTIVKDTTETLITLVSTKEMKKEVLFRFSKHYGMADKDDLGGVPYYISVEDQHIVPTLQTASDKSRSRDNAGVYVNLPSKVKLSLYQEEQLRSTVELYMGQFGKTEALNGELFGRRQNTRLILDPVTGNIESIQTEGIR